MDFSPVGWCRLHQLKPACVGSHAWARKLMCTYSYKLIYSSCSLVPRWGMLAHGGLTCNYFSLPFQPAKQWILVIIMCLPCESAVWWSYTEADCSRWWLNKLDATVEVFSISLPQTLAFLTAIQGLVLVLGSHFKWPAVWYSEKRLIYHHRRSKH